MLYADRDEFVKRFAEKETLSLEDPDNTGEPDADLTLTALTDASEEVDSYVAVRYTLPLPRIPEPLKRVTCDIARFRLYKDRPTEQVTYRYEQAIAWLKQIATGKASLVFDPVLTPVEEQAAQGPALPYGEHYEGGVFTDKLFNNIAKIR